MFYCTRLGSFRISEKFVQIFVNLTNLSSYLAIIGYIDIYVDGRKLARNVRKTAIFVSRKFWLSVSIFLTFLDCSLFDHEIA